MYFELIVSLPIIILGGSWAAYMKNSEKNDDNLFEIEMDEGMEDCPILLFDENSNHYYVYK